VKQFLISILFAIALTPTIVSAQSLIFCEKVTEDGVPKNPSHIFHISKEGGYFDFYVLLDKPVNTLHVKYDIFLVDGDGKEVFDATISKDVQKDWIWFPQRVTFLKSGDFTVYVYTAEDKLLCTGMVKVVMN